MKSLTSSLYLSEKTVFTAPEVALLWQETNSDNLKSKIGYYVKSGVLRSPRRGIYILVGKEYDKFEMANRLFVPSYVSLETVLLKEGVIFQYYESIFSISYHTREVLVDSHNYIYRCVNPKILNNPIGIINIGNYSIATKERAFLDNIYLYGPHHFDNLRSMDWDLCRRILPIYHSKQIEKHFLTYVQS